ncbi:MAG: hypothetical protein RMA76_26370 [Deltaproteobacteria bacterium]|jgi:apolipoprotein N-acyltransferase
MIRWLLPLGICGVALRIGQTGPAWLVPVALFAVFVVLYDRRTFAWAAGGLVIGLVFASGLLVALARSGIGWALAGWGAVAVGLGVSFGVVGAVASSQLASRRPTYVAAAWCAGLFLVDRLFFGPVVLTAPLAMEVGAYRRLLGLVGVPAAEGLIVLAVAGLAYAVRARRVAAVAYAAPLLFATFVASRAEVATSGQGKLHAVQPSFAWSEYASRAWSLESRAFLSSTLDALTAEALERGGTVVWPARGSGGPDAQLASRRSALTKAVRRARGADLVVVGPYDVGGLRRSAATLFTAKGPRATSAQGDAAPVFAAWFEDGAADDSSAPVVLDAKAGRLGVAIGFDVLSGAKVRGLVEAGAELLVVSADQAAFGPSMLGEWHAAYAVMRASEARRSLLFTSNRGAPISYDVRDGGVRRVGRARRRGAVSAALSRTRQSNDWHAVFAIWLALPLIFGARFVVRPWRGRALAVAAGVGLVAGPVVAILHVAAHRGATPVGVALDTVARAQAPRRVGALPRMFGPRAPDRRGPAALAYALTTLGDRVFEESLANAEGAEGLGRAARAHGFVTRRIDVDSLEAIELGAGRVAVGFEAGRYQVITRAGDRHWGFDPASGEEREIEAFAGEVLRIELAPAVQGASQPS